MYQILSLINLFIVSKQYNVSNNPCYNDYEPHVKSF